jgi:hypothetical protein
VFGAIGADGRVVNEPTVVPGAVLSATRRVATFSPELKTFPGTELLA